MYSRNGEIIVSGAQANVDAAAAVVDSLEKMYNNGEAITDQNVRYVISAVNDGMQQQLEVLSSDCVCVTFTGKPVKPKTLGQKKYVDSIRKNTIVFGIGPAGTGKTYLAVAQAVRAFKNHEIQRITRFFEVAPLAYMRGRTLDDSFIILDEAQNTTPEQMKMFLTRLGFNSKMVITGDITQIDLADNKRSGLVEASKVLKNIEGIEQIKFSEKDVVRHKLVQDIVKAYEKYAAEQSRRNK